MRAFAWLRREHRPTLHVAIDTGTGPAVVLVHGIASSHATFQNVIPRLEGRYRVIAVDVLGFGLSPSPADARFTLDEHVSALARTLAALDLSEKFVLVGHSMGALIAARYAAVRSSELAGLVLVSPPIYLAPENVGDPVDRAAMTFYRRLYDFLARRKSFTMRNAALIAQLAPMRDAVDVSERNWNAFVLSLQNTIQTQTAIADIAATDVSIHLVYGTLDPLLVPGAVHIVERMRHVTTHRVNGGDHFIRARMSRVVAIAVQSLSRRQ